MSAHTFSKFLNIPLQTLVNFEREILAKLCFDVQVYEKDYRQFFRLYGRYGSLRIDNAEYIKRPISVA